MWVREDNKGRPRIIERFFEEATKVDDLVDRTSTAPNSVSSSFSEKCPLASDARVLRVSHGEERESRLVHRIKRCVQGLILFSFAIAIFYKPTCILGQERTPRTVTILDPDGSSPVAARSVVASSIQETASVLEDFEVYPPVLTPSGLTDQTIDRNGDLNTSVIATIDPESSYTILLMKHDFGYSYGEPYVGESNLFPLFAYFCIFSHSKSIGKYTPPSYKFNRVTINFTVTSRGRQFDRLALMYFGDTEVWRTSTAEPTTTGIEWTYIKDMSEYMYFWNEPQKLIFDLGNIVDSTYTGWFNTTLTATFFTSDDTVDAAARIIPVSARNSASNAGSVFLLPSDNATNTVTLPRNINRAVFTISACGQATEEFWWSNVFSSAVDSFEEVDGTLYGYSPWREVQVFIDGMLAGVEWPFPVIFTGGVEPELWRPIVGVQAFNLREREIDLTPWLPILSDGNAHTFEIKVAGLNDINGTAGSLTETVGDSWYVTGKVFLWLDDDANSITTGTKPSILAPVPSIVLSQSLAQDSAGANESLIYNAAVHRTLSISSELKSATGGTRTATWLQTLSYTNYGALTAFGNIEVNNLLTTGTDTAKARDDVTYESIYTYPLWMNSTYIEDADGNITVITALTQGFNERVTGNSVFPSGVQPFADLRRAKGLTADTEGINNESQFDGASTSTTRNSSAFYFDSPNAGTSYGFGSTSQTLIFGGVLSGSDDEDVELYTRDVATVNDTIVHDKEVLLGGVLSEYTNPAGPGSGIRTGSGGVRPSRRPHGGFGSGV